MGILSGAARLMVDVRQTEPTPPRLQYVWETSTLRESLPLSPYDGLRYLYFDALTFDPRPLRYLAALVGAAHIVIGSDYPIMDTRPGQDVLEGGTIDRESIDSIMFESARACLRLP